jgi:type VII ESX secretion system EccE translocon-like protein
VNGKGVSFGVRRSPAVLFGQSWSQIAAESVGFGAALAALRAGQLLRTVGWLTLVLICAALAWIPVRGRNIVDYLPLYAGWWLRRATGHDIYRGGPTRMAAAEPTLPAPRLPGDLSTVEWLTYQADDGTGSRQPVAIVKDRSTGRYTAVLALRAATFALIEADEQRRRIEAYGAMLDALCREDSPLARLQLLERTLPDTSDPLHRDLATHGDPHAPDTALAAYEQLISAPPTWAQRHETYLAVTLDPRRGNARERIAAHGGGEGGTAATLFQLLSEIRAGLDAAAIEVIGWLPPRGLAAVLRTTFDPAGAENLARRGGGRDDEPGGDPGLPSGVDPRAVTMYGRAAFDHYQTDSAYHRTYWILEWPRVEVPAGFLQPLLLNSRYRRSLSLIMEPVPARRALRDADITASHLEGERRWRRKVGRRDRHRDTQEAAANERRESELTAGYGTYRFLGLITVTAATLTELDLACADVQSLAAQSRLETVPLILQQDQAFFAGALPLAQGLS